MRAFSAIPNILFSIAFFISSCSDESYFLRESRRSCPTDVITFNGEATFYWGADNTGTCSYDSSSGLMIGAMNEFDFDGSQICGASVCIAGPESTIIIRIVDRCPECPRGNIDLSPSAFSAIADTMLGRVPISWHLVPSDVEGPIAYRFKDSINQWWTAIQIRNHRYPIYSVEYVNALQTFQSLERTGYNYFAGYANMGNAPFTFRVTDVYGHQIIDSGIVPIYNKIISGKGQFPFCAIHE